MKINYLLGLLFFVFGSLQLQAQVLNQNANWPNPNWKVTGSYASDALEADPEITANFAFDDYNAYDGELIAAESPVIDLTAAFTAGEIYLKVTGDFGYNYLMGDKLEFQYYDADAGTWVTFASSGYELHGTTDFLFHDLCTYSESPYSSRTINISGFTATQLSGFKYRIFFDDTPLGGASYAFCFDAPTIMSMAPPTPVNDDFVDATQLNFNAYSTVSTNAAATSQTNEPVGNCFSSTGEVNSVWFSFDSPMGGDVRISITDASINKSQISVYAAPETPGDVATLLPAIECKHNGSTNRDYVLELNNLTYGDTYFIQVDSYNNNQGEFSIKVENLCPAPTNLISGNIGMTRANFRWDSSNGSSGSYEWYVFLADDDPLTAIPVMGGTIVSHVSSDILHIDGLTSGTQYAFYVKALCGSELAGPENFTTLDPTLTNDNIATAIPLILDAGCSGNIYTNVGATVQPDEPSPGCWGDDVQASVLFSFIAPPSTNVRISTDIPPFGLEDTQIAVYGMSMGNLVTIGCDEDSGTGATSELYLNNLTPGNTYYIQVDGYGGEEGNFCITVDSLTDIYYVNGVWAPLDPNEYVVQSYPFSFSVLEGTTTWNYDMNINSLSIKEGATLKIEQALSVDDYIINDGNLVFVNNANKLGQLGNMSGSTMTGSGEVTVQRYIPARDADDNGDINGAYRFITSAVNSTKSIHANWQEDANNIEGEPFDDPSPADPDDPNDPNDPVHSGYGILITGSIDGNDGFDATPAGAASMFTYDNSDNHEQKFEPIPDTDSRELVAGKGYLVYVWGDRSVDILSSNDPQATSTVLRATGSLEIGSQTISDLSNDADEFSLIGNPYQAIVDMEEVLGASTNINELHYYVWDPNLGTRGSYVTVDLSSGTNSAGTNNDGDPVSEANQYLMPGQAVWVVTKADEAASILFKESAKDVGANSRDVFRTAADERAYIELQLFQAERFANGESLSDGLRINFSETGDNAVLFNDALKLSNMDENIARVNDNDHLSIEYRAMPTDEEVLPLFSNQFRVEDYVFRANVNNLPAGTTAYLRDDYLDTQTELVNNKITLVEFSVDETIPVSIAPNRFSIVFAANPLSVDDHLITNGLSIYPNPTENGEFFIAIPRSSGEKIQVALYNILGQKVYTATETMKAAERINIRTGSLQQGVYMVEIKRNGKTSIGKVIVE